MAIAIVDDIERIVVGDPNIGAGPGVDLAINRWSLPATIAGAEFMQNAQSRTASPEALAASLQADGHVSAAARYATLCLGSARDQLAGLSAGGLQAVAAATEGRLHSVAR